MRRAPCGAPFCALRPPRRGVFRRGSADPGGGYGRLGCRFETSFRSFKKAFPSLKTTNRSLRTTPVARERKSTLTQRDVPAAIHRCGNVRQDPCHLVDLGAICNSEVERRTSTSLITCPIHQRIRTTSILGTCTIWPSPCLSTTERVLVNETSPTKSTVSIRSPRR